MFLELHMIQSFSPSNLNRDDTNNPKDCEFGGVRRARISSQCLKRAIRTCPEFAKATGVEPAARTRRVIQQLTEALTAAGKPDEEVATVVNAFVPAFLSKVDKDGVRTAVLLYLSAQERSAIAEALLEDWEASLAESKAQKGFKKLVRTLTRRFKAHTSAPDIALFGRMLAEHPELNLEAACQVAHALSTHRVNVEMDWWTAVDDLQPDDNAGAGMMGFGAFDSACFYRYARIHWDHLVDSLEDSDLARKTVEGFVRAAISAVPSGKQNAYAAYNPPSLILGVVREDGMAWSLANAFEQAVRANRDGGYVRPSVQALDAYWGRLTRVYGDDRLRRVAALCLEDDLPLESLSAHRYETQTEWLDALLSAFPAKEASA